MYKTPCSSAFIVNRNSNSNYNILTAQAKSKVIQNPKTARIVCNQENIGGNIGACCHGEDILGIWTTGAFCSFGTK